MTKGIAPSVPAVPGAQGMRPTQNHEETTKANFPENEAILKA
jgi:hypothetical protein